MNHYWCTKGKQVCEANRMGYLILGMLPQLMNDPSAFQQHVQPEHHQILYRFNHSVNNGDTLYEYYRSVPKKDGVITEAYRELATLNLMVDNYERTRNDDRAAQVRMESVKNDFSGTMMCLLSFLQKSHNFDMDWAMRRIDRLNVEKYGQDAAPTAKHVSDWTESDIEPLFEALKTVPFLAQRKEQLQ